jgi:radical SAM superfamily enzyme YgiQ (UPF0313 family)
MTFFTEASIDLADEPELMRLMVDANIVNVFVGVESPNEASLRETKKLQNLRPGGSQVEKVRRIQDAGMEVMAGMIVGFDHDDETIFDAAIEFIREARVINVMLGMLSAIPKTPLYDRMKQEGRLDTASEPEFGTNIVPLRLGRRQLREGFFRVFSALNETATYFDRFEDLYLGARMDYSRGAKRYWRRHPWDSAKARGILLGQGLGLLCRLTYKLRDPSLRREYLRRIWRVVRARPDPALFWLSVVKCACHYHAHTMARQMSGGKSALFNTYQASSPPQLSTVSLSSTAR